jgi:hypothetical protein
MQQMRSFGTRPCWVLEEWSYGAATKCQTWPHVLTLFYRYIIASFLLFPPIFPPISNLDQHDQDTRKEEHTAQVGCSYVFGIIANFQQLLTQPNDR